MIDITVKENCSGCHACFNVCPKKCIQMDSDEEGFWYPKVDIGKCIDCGLCENVCSIIHKWNSDESRPIKAIAAINKNEEIRLKSSSGGIFTLIADAIIEQGGVVFGAAFSNDFKTVHHICVDNIVDLEKLRGSKYVQSKIGDTYKQAKNYLENGRKVLFTGTPCQIAGLYSFLRKDYDNLYTQDIICHGVPSPMAWKKYVEEREKIAKSTTQRMFFRHKKYGWKSYSVFFEFLNKTKYVRTLQEDPFMRIFLSNSCLRPSCYYCSFKTVNRQSDLTLADFWGVQKVLPKMDDDKGTSVVLINSEKGLSIISLISDKIKHCSIDISIVTKYNPSIIQSAEVGKNRKNLFETIRNNSIDGVANKFYKISFKSKMKICLSKLRLYNFLLKIK